MCNRVKVRYQSLISQVIGCNLGCNMPLITLSQNHIQKDKQLFIKSSILYHYYIKNKLLWGSVLYVLM